MPADLRPGQPRAAAAGLLAGRLRPPRLGGRGLRPGRARRGQGARPHARSARRSGSSSPRASASCQGDFDDDDGVRDAARRPSRSSTRPAGTGGNFAFYLSVPPKFFPKVVAAAQEARAGRAARATPGGASSSRSRSATTWPAPRSSTRSCTRSSRPTRSSGSTTTWARRRSRTSWRCASPTRCSSRSGTGHYVDHVQITMAEDIGIGGRAGYYDGIGAARDVIQNHLLQLLALTAMEEPAPSTPRRCVAEKLKVLSAPCGCPRTWASTPCAASTRTGWQGGEKVLGYLRGGRHRPQVQDRHLRRGQAGDRQPPLGRASRSTCAPASGSAAGSPRSRWSSSARRTCPSSPARPRSWGRTPWSSGCSRTRASRCGSAPRCPGTSMEVRDVTMDFAYGESFTESSPEAYERLHPGRAARRRQPLPAAPRRSSCPGRSSTRSRSTGTSTASPRSTPSGHLGPGRGGRDARTRRHGAGGGHEDRPHGHHVQQDQRGAGRGPPGHRHPGRRHGADPGHRHRRGQRLRRAQGGQRRLPRAPLADPGGHQAARPLAARPGRRPAGRRGAGRRRRRAPARPSCCGCTASWPTTPSPSCCRCCCRTPRSSSGGRRTRRATPAQGPARARSRSAGSPTRPRPRTRSARSRVRADGYHPGRHRPGLDPDHPVALACWPPRWTRSTRTVTVGRRSRARPDNPSAELLALWLRRPAGRAGRARAVSDGPGHHRASGWPPRTATIVPGPRRTARSPTLSVPGQPDRHGGAQAAGDRRADRRGAAPARPGRHLRARR